MARLALVGLLVAGGGGAWAWRADAPKPAAGRGEAVAGTGPDGAEHRWRTGQPRHWRHIVTARR